MLDRIMTKIANDNTLTERVDNNLLKEASNLEVTLLENYKTAQEKKQVWNEKIKRDLDRAILQGYSYDSFLERLKEQKSSKLKPSQTIKVSGPRLVLFDQYF